MEGNSRGRESVSGKNIAEGNSNCEGMNNENKLKLI